MDLQTFQISDSRLSHLNWHFPSNIKLRTLQDPEDDDFLVNHKIDRSYDDSTVRFKLVVGNAVSANLKSTTELPIQPDTRKLIKDQGWISDEYEHLWRRDGGGSAALTSHSVLSFLLQTPRDGRSFVSLSLVNRDRAHCGGFYIADERYSLDNLLGGQEYTHRHPKVPKDFSILPFNVLVHHVEETLSDTQRLNRDLTSTEKRIANGDIKLDDNGDYKLLNRLNLEHLRLQRRSNFELELAENLMKYINEYFTMWERVGMWEGGTSYIDEMKEKIEQQTRYAKQVGIDLEVIPRRVKNQSKAIFNSIQQRDNQLNIQLAQSSRKIAEESRRDNLLNMEIAKATAQVAEETRQDSAAMKTIAVLGLTFLPGTAVATFFSMGMFNWNPGPGEPVCSAYIWVFFVVTIPVTVLVYMVWIWWFKISQKHYQTRHEKGLEDIEKKLKFAARSTTGTW